MPNTYQKLENCAPPSQSPELQIKITLIPNHPSLENEFWRWKLFIKKEGEEDAYALSFSPSGAITLDPSSFGEGGNYELEVHIPENIGEVNLNPDPVPPEVKL